MQQQDGSATATHPLQVGPQPLNTPEELRAIRQAMGAVSYTHLTLPTNSRV